MPELIVVEKIDGTPVSWRCSDCRQNFSVRGKFTTKERHRKVTAQFKSHLEESHKVKALAIGAAALAQH
jgi:transposase-like protein